MANIGFTDKQLHVYTRFQDMRRAYEDAHGRTYAPGFLTVLMDAFEIVKNISEADISNILNDHTVSLRAYIANAEANDPNLEPENETE